jgi:hypothetical protein
MPDQEGGLNPPYAAVRFQGRSPGVGDYKGHLWRLSSILTVGGASYARLAASAIALATAGQGI